MAFVLFSCEGNTTYEKVITNSSSENLFVRYNLQSFVEPDSMLVEAGQTKMITTYDQLGGNREGLDCLEDVVELIFTLPSGKTILKDPKSETNWTKASEKLGVGSYKHTCTYELKDGDIQ